MGTLIALLVRVLAFVAMLGVGLWQQVACADEGDFFRPYAGLTYGYDSNLRRFSSKELAEVFTGSRDTADTFLRKEAGIILDKQISLQRLYVDVSKNETTYNRNSEIDNEGKRLLGRWDWQVGVRLKGEALINHEETLVPFADFRGIELNLRTRDTKSFTANWLIHPRWQVRGALSDVNTDYSVVSQQVANLEERAQEVGLDYLAPSRSKVGLQLRHVRGDRPVPQLFFGQLIDNSYDQDELKAKIDWVYSAKTQLQFLGGFVERKHDELPVRDFSGFNARLNANWIATGKTMFNFGLWREIGGQSYVTSSYTLNQGAKLTWSWMWSAKTSFRADISREKVDFEGDLVATRSDNKKDFSAGVQYAPIKGLTLSLTANRSERTSTNQFVEYVSNGLFLSTQYAF